LFLICGVTVAQNTPTKSDVPPKSPPPAAKSSAAEPAMKSAKQKQPSAQVRRQDDVIRQQQVHIPQPTAQVPAAGREQNASRSNGDTQQTSNPDDGSGNSTPIKIGTPKKQTPPPPQ
jgi:hypothetical protein